MGLQKNNEELQLNCYSVVVYALSTLEVLH